MKDCEVCAGPDLDQAVERSLDPRAAPGSAMPYSTSPEMFIPLLELLGHQWHAEISLRRSKAGEWSCTIDGTEGGEEFGSEGTGKTMLEAGCRAIAQEYDE